MTRAALGALTTALVLAPGCGARTAIVEGDADLDAGTDADADDADVAFPSVIFRLTFRSDQPERICLPVADPLDPAFLEVETAAGVPVRWYEPFCTCRCDDCRAPGCVSCPDIEPGPGFVTLDEGDTTERVWEGGLVLEDRGAACPGHPCLDVARAAPGPYVARFCYGPGGMPGAPVEECWTYSARFCDEVPFVYPDDAVVHHTIDWGG